MADDDQRLRDSQREYLDFLDDEVCAILTQNTVDFEWLNALL